MVRVLFLLLLAFSASAADGLPDADPRTVIQGAEMIDAAIALVRERQPGLKLTTGIEGYETISMSNLKLKRKGELANPRAAQFLSPGPVSENVSLLLRLHNGVPIETPRSFNRVALGNWLFEQAERSVLPHELLAQAIIMHKGNTLLALTDIWNTLCQNWPAAATRNANTYAQRLYDVTGEYQLRDGAGHYVITDLARDPAAPIEKKIKFLVTKRGDVFSTYYHYFGAMLYSHYLAAKTGSPLTGKLAGRLAVKLEGALYRKTSGLALEREKRILNDVEGANAGGRLHAAVTHPEKIMPPAPVPAGTLPSYLRPDPRLSKNYILEDDGRAPVHFRSKADPKFQRGPMSVEELKLRFEYAVTKDEEIFNPFILATSSDGERLQNGLQIYLKDGARDAELNSWIQKFRSGWKGPGRYEQDFSLNQQMIESHMGMWKYDLYETARRAENLMDRVLEMRQLPRLTVGPPLPAAKGKPRGGFRGSCDELYGLLKEMAGADLQRRRE